MRNLKRALSMALAAVMVLGLMVVGASAASYNDFTDKDEIVHKDAVAMVTELGVLAGLPDGSFGGTQNIDRASFARLVCVVLNGGKEPVLGNLTTTFTDTQGNWAEKYIAFCVDRGIIAGRGNNTFGPSDNVTGSEAAKMLLVALGYNTTYEGIGGATWEITTNSLANLAGLYEDLETINPSEPLTRDDAAQMIYNVLNANVVDYTFSFNADGSTTAVQNKTGKTMLEDKFGVTKVDAVIVGNEYATLSGGSSAAKDEGKTQIVVADGDKGVSGTYNVSTPVDYLGKSVTMFIQYKNSNSDKDAVVYGSPIVSEDNNVVVSTDGSKLTDDLLDDNDLTVGNNTKALVNYGDVTPTTVTAANIDTAINPVKGGTLTLIDNDNDDVVEYVLYVEYKAGAVTSYSTTGDGSIKVAGFDKNDKANEKVVGFEDVQKGDFVLAVEYGGKLYVQKPETVTGEMTAYSTSKKNITVDGTNYDWSALTASVASTTKEMTLIADYAAKGALNNTATFYLDNNGYVVAVSDADETYGNYAVVLAKQEYDAGSATSLGQVAKVKLLLSDGTVGTYEVSTIDGVKPGETAYDAKERNVGQYDIYSYNLTDDGKVKLGTEKTASTSQSVSFDSGKATLTVNTKNYTVTGNTVFLYWNNDEVTRFVGKSAPDLSGSKTMGIVANNSGEAELVFVQSAAANQFDGNYLYVYKTKIGENSDGYEVSAILKDGTITTITVDSASYINGSSGATNAISTSAMTIVPGMYNYSVEDGVYTLSQVDSDSNNAMDYVTSGTVTGVANDYVKIASTYTLNNTVVVYGETNKTAEADEVITKGDNVVVVYNDDDEAVFVVITKRAADEYSVTMTGNNASNKLTYTVNGDIKTVDNTTGLLPVGTELTVTAETNNMVVVSVNGVAQQYLKNSDTYTMTGADTTFTVMAKPTVTVSGDGVSANNVTATANAISGTAYMPGDKVTVTVTLSGTAASDDTLVTITGVTGGTYAGTPTDATVTSTGVTVANGKTADGTFTYTFTMGTESVTPAVSVASAE